MLCMPRLMTGLAGGACCIWLLGAGFPAAAATAEAQRCHELAADPDDPMKDAAVAGVMTGDLPPESIEACREAVSRAPDDPVLNYQLGRALLEFGHIDEAQAPLARAANAGEPGALYLYGLLLMEYGGGAVEDVVDALSRSQAEGYEPAALALEDFAADELQEEPQDQPPDYSAFERPDIIRALVEGDMSFLTNVQVGVLLESIGGPMGFLKYFEGMQGALASPIVCPTLLPAGAGPLLASRYANRFLNDTLGGGDPFANPRMMEGLGGMLNVMKNMFERPAETMGAMNTGEALLAMVPEQGTKDGYLIQKLGELGDPNWGCDGHASLAIAQTIRDLMR